MRRTAWTLVVAIAAGAAFAGPEDPAPPAKAPAADAAPHPLEGLWDVRMERAVWWPHLVPGSLAVWRGPSGLRASATFDPMWGVDPKLVRVDPAEGDRVRFFVHHEARADAPIVRIEGRLRDGVLDAQAHWDGADPPEVCRFAAERVAAVRRFEPDSEGGPFSAERDAAAVGVDPAALDRLIRYAERYDTDALVVVKNGKLLCDRTFLRPRGTVPLGLVTEAVASLAAPILAADGKLPAGVDTPVGASVRGWKDDPRGALTLRDALRSPTPGAPDPLADLVPLAAGEPIETFVQRRLLAPLGIERFGWRRDPSGLASPRTGLELSGVDLARVGWTVARDGRWNLQPVVPETWLAAAAAPSPPADESGLGWRLRRRPGDEVVVQTAARLDRLRESGFAEAEALRPFVGRSFAGRTKWWSAAAEALGDDELVRKLHRTLGEGVAADVTGPVSGLWQFGENGQYLVVFPREQLVVVRLRRAFAEDELPADVKERAAFPDLVRLAESLVP